MGKDTSQQLTIYKTMQEQLQTLTLEEAFAHELAKDVKLKGGGTAIDPDTGQPLKPAKAIAMSIMQQALKGDIAAVSFIRNFLRQTDPQEAEQRKREAADKLAATTQTLRAELERDNLWTGQVVELEQLAQDHCVIDRLNQQMQADDYQDILTEMKKDGTMTVRTHPLLDIRNKLQKQWQADWQAHRQEAFRRIQMKRMQQKQN